MRFCHTIFYLYIYSQNNSYYQTEKNIPFLLAYHILRSQLSLLRYCCFIKAALNHLCLSLS